MSTKVIEPIGIPNYEEDEVALTSINKTTNKQKIFFAIMSIFIVWGATSLIYQWTVGLGITGLGKPLYWGFYITNFVFFIGISHAGTLISAILRLSDAEWRRPITRMAEAITAFALIVGASQVLIDMGRIEKLLNILLYPQPRSPLFWDVCSVSVYFTGSLLYLYGPLIPDLAMLRDHFKEKSKIRYWFYNMLSLGWHGDAVQSRRLSRFVSFMMIFIIPVAVSVHTVISWIFSMTIQPMWHSTIFGPYFVVGAIYSGIGALIAIMVLFRNIFNLQDYLKLIHFQQLAKLLLAMTCLWFYFTFAEFLTTYYGDIPEEMSVFNAKLYGEFAFLFWLMIGCMVVTFILLAIPKLRTLNNFMFAGILLNVGMWLERFLIISPTLGHPRLPYESAFYIPSFWEWGEFLGSIAAFLLLFVLFAKVFPLISVWEIQEGRKEAIPDIINKFKGYMPNTGVIKESVDS